jgi:hypothetical protein
MSNQELQNQSEKKENEDVNKRRRFIKGAGIAAPVIMTLASRPVFGGALCMSQMMSGNISHAVNGSCAFGNSPGGWKTPVGRTVLGVPFVSADRTTTVVNNVTYYIYKWAGGKFVYGLLPIKKPGNSKQWSAYSGGSTYADAFGTGSTMSMREILNKQPGSEEFHLIAAILNAYHVPGYPLTVDQVKALNLSRVSPIPGMDLKTFLSKTWVS